MAINKKTLFADNLDKIPTSYTDVDPLSKYFKLTELPDTFTGGKNAFLIQGSEYLVADSLIKIELKDSKGDIIYHEPGEGIVSASVNGEPIVTEYYEGVSKVVSVYIYSDTAYGPCTITILGELASYDNNGIKTPVSTGDEGFYNVKWQKEINVVPSLANDTRIRFYKRPTASISEILSPIYSFVGDTKVASAITQSFANIKLSNLETFAGDVKRVKVFRTSIGDISDYDLIQDILVESKELLTTDELTGSVVGNTGVFTSEVLKTQWNTGSLNAFLTSSRVEAGVRLTGSGLFTYTQSLDLKSTNTYELSLDAFYSSSTDSNLGIYLVSGSTSSSIATLVGTQPTKNLLDTTIPFKIDRDYPTASLYFSQSQGEWHLGNISLKLSEDTAFSPDEIGFITTMPTVLGNETFNFKFEFYDINNNYVPVEVTQSATFTGGNTNIGGTILLISSSTSQSLADLNRVSSSISGTMTVYSSSASSSVSILSGSLSGSISVVSGSVFTLSGSVSGTIGSLSSSISQSSALNLSESLSKVKLLADGGYPGTFIESSSIYSPNIAGINGYFSNKFQVGQTNPIVLDASTATRKIYVGTGTYNNTNTSIYLDSTGQFSLKDKLTFDTSGNLSVNGSITVTGGNAATDTNALLYAARAAASASISGSNALSASDRAAASASLSGSAATAYALSQSTYTYNQSTALLQTLADGGYSGSFIGSTTIYSPNIGGQNGFISNILRVGQNGITLDGGNKAIYVGSGTYANSNTPFYFKSGSTNVFSLGDKLTFDGTTLSINGNITVAGGNAATTTQVGTAQTTANNAATAASTAQTTADGKIPSGSAAADVNSNVTNISGGKIRTGIIESTGFSYTSGDYSVTGTQINLDNGLIRSKNFVITSAGDAKFRGNIEATGGSFTGFMTAGTAKIGVDVSGTEDGLLIDGTNYWFTDSGAGAQFKFGTATQNLSYNSSYGGPVAYASTGTALWVQSDGTNSGFAALNVFDGGIKANNSKAANGAYAIQTGGTNPNIYVAGEIRATGNIIAYYSDERLKTKLGNIDNAVDKLSQLNGFYYKNNDIANSFGYTDDKTQLGLSAQEVQSVFPDIINPAPFDTIDSNGGSKSGENYLTIDYSKLVPVLVEAIKELKAEIEELKRNK